MGLKEIDLNAWTGFVWLRIRTTADSREDGNESSGSIKCGEFLD